MSKIVRSLGRVAGSRWYAGTFFEEAVKPLDKDMFFKTDTLEFYQYDEKYKLWYKKGQISFDNYIVAENVKTSEDVTKSINGIPFKEIFEFVDYGNGEVFTTKVKRAKEAENCSTSVYAQKADGDELGNRIIETYATKKELNDLIGVEHNDFATKSALENGTLIPVKAEYASRSDTSNTATNAVYASETNMANAIKINTEIVNFDEDGSVNDSKLLSDFIEIESGGNLTGKVKKAVEADVAKEANTATMANNSEFITGKKISSNIATDEIYISSKGLYLCTVEAYTNTGGAQNIRWNVFLNVLDLTKQVKSIFIPYHENDYAEYCSVIYAPNYDYIEVGIEVGDIKIGSYYCDIDRDKTYDYFKIVDCRKLIEY